MLRKVARHVYISCIKIEPNKQTIDPESMLQSKLEQNGGKRMVSAIVYARANGGVACERHTEKSVSSFIMQKAIKHRLNR